MSEKNIAFKIKEESIKALNNARMFQKVTPKYDLSWYIKWTASFIILIGMVLTSVGESEPYNLFFHLLGVLGWGVVGMLWHDRALIFINGIAVFIFASGIARFYFGV
tara:strand:- start:859 stop:1179 length:321 start_codon:yes stop_codon:yes gene_type:complete